MSKNISVTLLAALYTAAREELVKRIGLRDTALFFYVSAIGVYLSFISSVHFFKDKCTCDHMYEVLLLVPLPFVCLIFSLIVIQHHMAIGSISDYLIIEWQKQAPDSLVQWDNSKINKLMNPKLQQLRTWPQFIVLILPLMYENFLYFAEPACLNELSGLPQGIFRFVTLISFVLAFYVGFLHYETHKKRKGEKQIDIDK